MTSPSMQRVGGWAALAVVLLGFAAVVMGLYLPGTLEDRLSRPPYTVVTLSRSLAFLIAVIGLHGWFAARDDRLASPALVAGVIGSSLAVLSDTIALVAGSPGAAALPISVLSGLGLGSWLLLAGTLLRGGVERRTGLAGQIGGAGTIGQSLLVPLQAQLPALAATTLGAFAGLFSLGFLYFMIRVWRSVTSNTRVAVNPT